MIKPAYKDGQWKQYSCFEENIFNFMFFDILFSVYSSSDIFDAYNDFKFKSKSSSFFIFWEFFFK